MGLGNVHYRGSLVHIFTTITDLIAVLHSSIQQAFKAAQMPPSPHTPLLTPYQCDPRTPFIRTSTNKVGCTSTGYQLSYVCMYVCCSGYVITPYMCTTNIDSLNDPHTVTSTHTPSTHKGACTRGHTPQPLPHSHRPKGPLITSR